MEELRGRIEVVPDPELIMEKMIEKRMHMMKPAGMFLIIAGIWWLLTNVKVLPKAIIGPGLLVMAGIMCLSRAKWMHEHHHKEW